jgi:hypothetical protein
MQSPEARIREILMSLHDPKEAFEWLFSRQLLFDGEVPIAMIASGQIMRVLDGLESLDVHA